MSKKTTTESEATKEESYIYIGPTLKNGALFKNKIVTSIPEEELKEVFEAEPRLRNCFIKVSEYPEVKAELKDPNSGISLILKGVI